MTVLKISPYLEPLPIKRNYAQFWPDRKRMYVQFLELWSKAKLLLEQRVKAHGPLDNLSEDQPNNIV